MAQSKSSSRTLIRFNLNLVTLIALSGSIFPTTAYAYIDPGSGSVILTTILGLLGAVSFTLRKYFYKIKRLFRSNKSSGDETNND